MTEQTRRNVLRYGIAIDLVIVATGVGMVVPPTPLLLIIAFTAAILLSTWKGGWKGGATALVLSIIAMAAVFPDITRFPHLMAVTLLGFAGAAVVLAMERRPPVGRSADLRSASPVAELELDAPAEEEALIARELEERLAREREEAEQREAEEARQRVEAERIAAEEEARKRAEAERDRRENEERLAREREEAEQRAAEEARQRMEAERQRVEEERQRIAEERQRVEDERKRIEAERVAAEEARQRAEAERQRVEQELAADLARQREASLRELTERMEAERRAAEEDARRQLEAEREQLRIRAEQEVAAERARVERETAARIAAVTPPPPPTPTPQRPAPPAPPKSSLLETVAAWFKPAPRPRTALNVHRNGGDTTARKRAQSTRPNTAPAAPAKPRLLMIERRRATADTIAPRLRQRGVDIEVVERWVDAVDELFRFRPNALFLDVEHPEFEKIHRTVSEKTPQMPIVLTGRSAASFGGTFRYAAFIVRPYETDELMRIAQTAQTRVEDLLAAQAMPRTAPKPVQSTPPPPVPLARPASRPTPVPVKPIPLSPMEPVAPKRAAASSGNADGYEVVCYSCRIPFDAMDADWCSCLAKERTLVCTNCLSCFCKAPPAFKEKFWVEAPPRLFERKTAELRKHEGKLAHNPSPHDVQRPLVLAVEDDEEIQAIVQRVCSNLGYGFIWATNGQDGLDIARAYRPNLILSDAFMPKLDGREMCRMLKEEPIGADMRMVVMTGLYTDTKYRSEAVKRFHVDDYIAKPVSITELINLLQRHLEGVTGLPMQEDLYELHRKEIEEAEAASSDDIPLSDVLAGAGEPALPLREVKRADGYEVQCFNCQRTFDATRAEWCSCVGRDNTLACEHCGGCFCKAPATYRERFWIDAPSSLFERKMIGSKRNLGARSNPPPLEVKRPLILLVEDDENVQLIVRTVVSSMGYGFVVGANGQEGLSLAREYGPDLILSDAFMPKLDGREMCRLLKEDPATARAKAIIMTGLYTDRKYRNEALDYFKVDDYVAKPLAVDDLIKLFKKHLPQEAVAS